MDGLYNKNPGMSKNKQSISANLKNGIPCTAWLYFMLYLVLLIQRPVKIN